MTTHKRTFESFGDLLAMGKMPKDVTGGDLYETRSSESRANEERWDFGVGLDGARKLAETGWREGAKKVDELSETISRRIQTAMAPVLGYSYGVDGGAWVDVGRYCSGEPEHFAQFGGARARRPYEILTNITASCGIRSENIRRRGAAVLALIKILEARGWSCGITLCVSLSGGYELTCPVKHPGAVLDIDQLAFQATHPAMFRRLVFAVQEREPDAIRRKFGFNSEGYGSITEAEAETIRKYDLHMPVIGYSEFDSDQFVHDWVCKRVSDAEISIAGKLEDVA